jgi:hypothetical protein
MLTTKELYWAAGKRTGIQMLVPRRFSEMARLNRGGKRTFSLPEKTVVIVFAAMPIDVAAKDTL